MYKLTETESKFADLIWDNEPMGSGELVKLCEKHFGWKKSTTYTMLKRLCAKGIFKNEASTVTAVLSKTQFQQKKSEQFVEETFGDSLPQFLATFMGGKKLNQKQVEEMKRLIDAYEEEK